MLAVEILCVFQSVPVAQAPVHDTAICGATTTATINGTSVAVPFNPPVCDAALRETCTIGKCRTDSGSTKKWLDASAEYGTSNWGGDNQCKLADGGWKATCSNSLKDMSETDKEGYMSRMISGCRLGAERSCVEDKYRYDKPATKVFDDLASTLRSPSADAWLCLLVSVALSLSLAALA